MNRRHFLSLLGLGGTGLALVQALPEALWTPTKTFFLPPVNGWATQWTEKDWAWFTKTAIEMMENNLAVTKMIHHQYDAQFSGGMRSGRAIMLMDRQPFVARESGVFVPLQTTQEMHGSWGDDDE